jgi:hypothetical protein
MWELDVLLVMVLAAVMLAGLARRAGAPYPVFLALGGALLALLWVSPCSRRIATPGHDEKKCARQFKPRPMGVIGEEPDLPPPAPIGNPV